MMAQENLSQLGQRIDEAQAKVAAPEGPRPRRGWFAGRLVRQPPLAA